MMAPITPASYVLKAIVLTSLVIETFAGSQVKGARDIVNHYYMPRCSKSLSAFKNEMYGTAGHKTFLVSPAYRIHCPLPHQYFAI